MNSVQPKGNHNKTLTGILIPEKWDETGNVIGISIQTFDECEYIVKTKKHGAKLIDFVKQKVKLTGKVREVAGKKSIIEVIRFEVLDS